MEINKLKVFLDLAKTLNYSETAERLFTTQGNVSKQILSLEKELNVKLFKRAHRTISLTPSGLLVKPYARKILNDYESLMIKLADQEDQQKMTIKLLTIPTMPNYQGFTILSNFMKKYPEIRVQLQETESNRLFDDLRRNDCDVIFSRTFGFNDQDLEKIETESDRFVAAVPKKSNLAQESHLDLYDLRNEKFLLMAESTNLYQPVIEMTKQLGFQPNIVYKGTRVDLILGMVARSMGISILTEKTARGYNNEDVQLVELEDSLISHLNFIRKKEHASSASDIFWKFIQQQLQK